MRTGLLLTGILIAGNVVMAQSSYRMTRSQYFETYKEMAIHEMERSGVPASITLAQGALESGDGNSNLALMANNHFGIKCHKDWNGKRVHQDDDAKNECFRKYRSVEDSYRDHSDYLRSQSRYASLFELDVTDYKRWAKGLKKAGYATSPTYAESLIRIIEEFNLDRYDRPGERVRLPHETVSHRNIISSSRTIMEKNRVKYIVAKPGDTFEKITDEFGKLSWEIPQYNDIRNVDSLISGQIIFIQPKRNKAEIGKNTHMVKEGETMYTISQHYAIKLDRLYFLNQISPGTRPSPGTTLQLRKPLKRTLPKPVLTEPDQDSDEEEIRIDLNLE